MKKIPYLLILFLTTNVGFAQSGNDLKIEFDHKQRLKKFIPMQTTREDARKIQAHKPYVHSATIKLTLNLQGEILASEFIEKAETEIFNQMFQRMANSTSGKWKISNAPSGATQVYLIIPLIHKTPPDSYPKTWLTLFDQFTEYHNNLKFSDIEGCNQSNCIILEQIRNYTGTAVH